MCFQLIISFLDIFSSSSLAYGERDVFRFVCRVLSASCSVYNRACHGTWPSVSTNNRQQISHEWIMALSQDSDMILR